MLNNIDKSKIIFGDFMIQKIDKLYKTIIENPSYVRTDNCMSILLLFYTYKYVSL